MTRIELLDTMSDSDHLPISTEISVKIEHAPLPETRETIKKNVKESDIIEKLLFESDWPRIPFNKCWPIKQYLSTPSKN